MKKPRHIPLVSAHSLSKQILREVNDKEGYFKKLADATDYSIRDWIEEGRIATRRRRQQERDGKLMLVIKEHFQQLHCLTLRNFRLVK